MTNAKAETNSTTLTRKDTMASTTPSDPGLQCSTLSVTRMPISVEP